MAKKRYPGMHGNRQILSLLMIRQAFACFYCDSQIILDVAEAHPARATLDHKVPLVFGGEPFGDNAVAACRLCNGSKSCLDAETFLAVRGDHPARRKLIREAQVRAETQTEEERRQNYQRIKSTHRASRHRLWTRLQPILEQYKADRTI